MIYKLEANLPCTMQQGSSAAGGGHPALQSIFAFVAHYKMVRRERSGPFPSLAIYAIMKFAARPARDVEDAVPYCGAGHIIDSRFSNIPKFRCGQVTTPYRLFHPPSHISNSLFQLLTPNFSFSLFPKKFSPFSSFCSNPKNSS